MASLWYLFLVNVYFVLQMVLCDPVTNYCLYYSSYWLRKEAVLVIFIWKSLQAELMQRIRFKFKLTRSEDFVSGASMNNTFELCNLNSLQYFLNECYVPLKMFLYVGKTMAVANFFFRRPGNYWVGIWEKGSRIICLWITASWRLESLLDYEVFR